MQPLLSRLLSRLVALKFSATLHDFAVSIAKEIAKRRTFAIISHPDAGKTTLTEKLLLYGGAVQLAGSVTARKNQRATTSDWMELEKKRGISISSTVLQFDYDGYRINLLDTPGHKDFSEDTYRVLTAVVAVVMVIDAAMGFEPQTRKLLEVCRQRGVPIFTFMNKCDRPMKPPLELLDELERVLGIGAFPVNWPIGNGPEFQGVYDRQTRAMHARLNASWAANIAPRSRSAVCTIRRCGGNLKRRGICQDAGRSWKCSSTPGEAFDEAAVLAGKTTPVFFGSAVNNFGVRMLLDGFLKHSPAAETARDGWHRNRAGKPRVQRVYFQDPGEHGSQAPRPHRVYPRLLGQVRARHDGASFAVGEKGAPVELAPKFSATNAKPWTEAYPGDVIGLVGHDSFGIGVTRSRRTQRFSTRKFPRFTRPRAFSYLHNPNTAKYKQFRQGA